LIVGIVSSLYAPHAHGGAERVAQDVAEALVARGHQVHVLTLGKPGGAGRAQINGVSVRYSPLRNLYWPFPVSQAGFAMKAAWHAIDAYNPAMASAAGEWLDEVRPDLVHTHNLAGFSAAVWPAAAQRGIRLLHTLHDHYLLCPYSIMYRNDANCASQCLRCRIASAPRRALTRHVAGVVGVSNFVLQRHLERGLFAAARSSVVHNGYRAPAAIAQSSRAGQRLRIGYLGSLVPAKGLDRLVDAFLGLPDGAAELHIAGAGDVDYEALLKQRTVARSDVRWCGVVRPEEFLPGLDLLVMPTLCHEAMGRVVVEAFAHGLPVIAASRGGIPELFRGECGWLYDPDDRGRLPAILREVLGRREALEPMRQAARAAARHASDETMIEGYLAMYEATAAR
jgi:glycosyltransferase involved in cell wall biosynthesis